MKSEGSGTKTRLWILAGVVLSLAVLAVCGRLLVSLAFSNAGMVALLGELQDGARQVRLDASALFGQAMRWDARNPAAHRGLAWVNWLDGASATAGAEWRVGGVTPQDFIPSGSWALSQGDADEALAWYERAIAVQPELGDAYYLAGSLCEATRRWDEALSLYDEALSKGTFADAELLDKARTHRLALIRGQCSRGATTAEEAEDILAWCARAAADSPEVGDAYYYAARARWFLGSQEEALTLLEQALAQPAFSDSHIEISAHLTKADILRVLERFEEAVSEYEWVVAHDSDRYWAYMGLGMSWWQGYGNADRAEEALNEAAALEPGWQYAYHWLGDIYSSTGRRDMALDMYEKVLEIDPENEKAKEQVTALQGESP